MFTLNVRADVSGPIAQLNRLKAGLGDQVIVVALNETIQQAQTQVTRVISADYNITQREIRDKLSIARASRKGQRFEATLYGMKSGGKWSLNVARFMVAAGQKRRANRAARLAQAFGGRAVIDPLFRIRRGSAPAPIVGAFVLNVPGQPVVQRIGGRLVSVQRVGVPQMFERPSVQNRIVAWMPNKFAEIFERRMRYFASTIK